MGTFGMFTTTRTYEIQKPTSQFFSSQLINTEWVQPGNVEHTMFAASGDIQDAAGHSLVTAYALLRPDAQWSLLLVNRDQENAHRVRIEFHDAAGVRSLAGPVNVITFGSAQYQWHPTNEGGFPDPDGPPLKFTVAAKADTTFELPKASIIVVRGTAASVSSKTH